MTKTCPYCFIGPPLLCAQWHKENPVQPATRQQKDFPFDTMSIKTGLACQSDPEGKSITRQEQGADTDINRILEQYGVPFGRQQLYVDVDYDLNLQQIYQARDDYAMAVANLPPEIKELFPTPQHLDHALRDGTFDATVQKALADRAKNPQRSSDNETADNHASIRDDSRTESPRSEGRRRKGQTAGGPDSRREE